VTSRWTDLDRPPLSAARLRRAFEGDELWHEIRVVDQTTSTNADVAAVAGQGAAAGFVLIAEEQTAGRGRLDRAWQAPARSAVLMSVLLRPDVPTGSLPLLSLVAGVAAVEAVRSVAELPAVLKWPNDVLVGGQKLGGILVERVDSAAVVGLGINVSLRTSELPVETATSIAIEGGNTDRESLTKELLRAIGRRVRSWEAVSGAGTTVLPAYREVCDTLGREVVLHLPDGATVSGVAEAIDDTGRLVVVTPDGHGRAWSVGDVVHVRAGG
jgi:BirA family biotin operon repressor/biotin-[acetyl-CoA-carboxylase] ligase